MTQFVANGLCNGAVYALVALGFGLVFFAARTFHIAHGAVYVASAYVCYALLIGLGFPLILAVFVGVAAGVGLGVLIETVVYYPLADPRVKRKGSPLVVMVSSLGVYVVVVNIVALFFGNETKILRPGVERTLSIGGVILTYVQVSQLLICVAAVTALWVFLNKTSYGRTFRALADDPELVSVLGYDVRKLRIAVFGIASGLAGLGGILTALDVGVDPHVGMDAMLVSAVASILGGFGNLLAPVLGAFILGLLQSMVVWLTSAKWSSAVVFAALIVVLLARPQGLLAHTRRTEEA